MTKKDYKLVGQALKLAQPPANYPSEGHMSYEEGRRDESWAKWTEIVYLLANGLAIDPKFSRSKFLETCGCGIETKPKQIWQDGTKSRMGKWIKSQD